MRRRLALSALLIAMFAPLTVHPEPQMRVALGGCASMGPALGACGARQVFAPSTRLSAIKTLNERAGRAALPKAPPKGAMAAAMAPIEPRPATFAAGPQAERDESEAGSAQGAFGRNLRRGAFLALLLSGEHVRVGN